MPRLISKSNEEFAPFYDLRLGLNRLGRKSENNFQIDHPTVSAAHCEITWLDDGVIRVHDRGSTNGTFIDGAPITDGKLHEGQVLRLGDVEFILDSEAARISVPKMEVKPLRPEPLPDGAIACFNHHQLPASSRCTKCGKEYCTGCIHQLHRIGGKLLKLCPDCSGAMEPLPGHETARRRKKSFFGRLADTLKMQLKD